MLTVKHFFPLKIRRVTLLMSVLCCCMTAGAQEFVVPQTNINAKGYPHVLPDNSVEFRIRSNDDLSQMTVSLDPSCRFSKQSDGSWMAHTKPLVPGFHYYWFRLGGMEPCQQELFRLWKDDQCHRHTRGWLQLLRYQGCAARQGQHRHLLLQSEKGVCHDVCLYSCQLFRRQQTLSGIVPPAWGR